MWLLATRRRCLNPPPKKKTLSACFTPPFRGRTYDVQLSRHLLGAEAVGDLAGVAAAVLLPQVADGEARQTPGPAGIRGQRAAIFQPAHGGVGVTPCNAGELNALSRVDFACLETVQDGRRGLVGV